MKRFFVALALVLSPVPVLADDASYCAQLGNLALRYLGQESPGVSVPDLDVAAAIDQCRRGNFAEGIPTLERKLRANGFTLPKR
jgi:hypothetical protein